MFLSLLLNLGLTNKAPKKSQHHISVFPGSITENNAVQLQELNRLTSFFGVT